jgi:hypothetical protein
MHLVQPSSAPSRSPAPTVTVFSPSRSNSTVGQAQRFAEAAALGKAHFFRFTPCNPVKVIEEM